MRTIKLYMPKTFKGKNIYIFILEYSINKKIFKLFYILFLNFYFKYYFFFFTLLFLFTHKYYKNKFIN